MKYVSLANLTQFYNKLVTTFSKLGHKHNKTEVTGVVDDVNISGYTLTFTSNGTTVKTINLPKEFDVTLSTRTIVPGTTNQTISSRTLITGTQTIQGDANLVPEKILRGANNVRNSIFGVFGVLDKIKRIKDYTDGSYAYALQVADVAKTYHLSRLNGSASYQYNANTNLFTGNITNSSGHCLIDCSTFIGLVLRGVEFKDSPFATLNGTPNATVDTSTIANLYENSPYHWKNPYLDMQVDPSYHNIGYMNYRSLRRAADYGEYFYSRGYTIYEYDTSPTSAPTDLQPGDLLFWSKPGEDENDNAQQKSRFKAITHIGIVARDTARYYQVTGSSSVKGDTVFYSYVANDLQYMSMICRPNYNPTFLSITPIGVNLLPKYCYDDLYATTLTTKSGVTFTINNNGELSTKGVATSSVTFKIYDSAKPILIEPGTYTLSGTPVHPETDANGTSYKWGISVKDVAGTQLGWDRGAGATFTVGMPTEIYAYIYISSSLTSTNTFIYTPKLERIS